jgi:hypothetical protein
MTTSTHTTAARAPMAAAPTLVPLTDINSLSAAGIEYPKTVDGWRWLYRVRAERGMERAFRRVGRRVLVDVPAYLAAVREQPGV